MIKENMSMLKYEVKCRQHKYQTCEMIDAQIRLTKKTELKSRTLICHSVCENVIGLKVKGPKPQLCSNTSKLVFGKI